LIVSTTEKSGSGPEFDVAIVLTTIGVGVDTDPAALARTLVEERLAACVNILPAMTSVYRWEGRIEKDQERQLVIKTTHDRLGALEARLRHLHPYEVPEFLVLAASGGSEAYLRWVRESATPEPKS
jgi:periplasmic divalent cation tolerance protein